MIRHKEEHVGPVEVIRSVERRRRWTAAQKRVMVKNARSVETF